MDEIVVKIVGCETIQYRNNFCFHAKTNLQLWSQYFETFLCLNKFLFDCK